MEKLERIIFSLAFETIILNIDRKNTQVVEALNCMHTEDLRQKQLQDLYIFHVCIFLYMYICKCYICTYVHLYNCSFVTFYFSPLKICTFEYYAFVHFTFGRNTFVHYTYVQCTFIHYTFGHYTFVHHTFIHVYIYWFKHL